LTQDKFHLSDFGFSVDVFLDDALYLRPVLVDKSFELADFLFVLCDKMLFLLQLILEFCDGLAHFLDFVQ
jgi:hypothetical protein